MRYQSWARRYTYAFKMDIARYFPSIDHRLLKEKLRRCIKDRKVLALLDRIIDFSPPSPDDAPLIYFPGDDLFTPLERRVGIPIGNGCGSFSAALRPVRPPPKRSLAIRERWLRSCSWVL